MPGPLIPLKEEGVRGMSSVEEGSGEADNDGGAVAEEGWQLERDDAAGGGEEEREEEEGEKAEEKQDGSLESDAEADAGEQASRSSMG